MSQETLSETEEAFVAHYLVGFNASCAAREIGIPANKAARVGARIRHRPNVAARIAARCAAQSQNARELADIGFQKIVNRAFFRMDRFLRVDEQGNIAFDLRRATEQDWDAVRRFRVFIRTEGTGLDRKAVVGIGFRGPDVLRALAWLLRYYSPPTARRRRTTSTNQSRRKTA